MLKNHHITDPAITQSEVIFNQQNLGIGTASGVQPTKQTEKKRTTQSQRQIENHILKIARKSSQILFQTKTVFPFDFFPDTLTINANKIDIVNSEFFASNRTTSIPLNDIANVEVQTVPFFATIRIISIRFPMKPIVLHYLKKTEAIKAKNIIDGLLVAISQGADITNIDPQTILKQIETAGKSNVEE